MYTYTGLVHKGPSESIFHSQHCLCTSALWSLLLQRSFLGRLIVLKIPLHQVCTATNCSAQHLMKIWARWVKLILFVTTRITSYPSWVFHQWQQKASGELRPWEFENSSTMATTSHTITSESSIMAMTFHPVHIKLSPSGLRSNIRSRHTLYRPKKLKFQPSLNAVSHHSGVTVNDVQVNVFVNTMNNLSEMSVIIQWDWLEAERNFLETDKIPAEACLKSKISRGQSPQRSQSIFWNRTAAPLGSTSGTVTVTVFKSRRSHNFSLSQGSCHIPLSLPDTFLW